MADDTLRLFGVESGSMESEDSLYSHTYIGLLRQLR